MQISEMSVFFFSSRRRHTRFDCDWSSDVCSSDLAQPSNGKQPPEACSSHAKLATRSEERRVGKSVDLGGRRIIKKKKRNKKQTEEKKKKRKIKNKEKKSEIN